MTNRNQPSREVKKEQSYEARLVEFRDYLVEKVKHYGAEQTKARERKDQIMVAVFSDLRSEAEGVRDSFYKTFPEIKPETKGGQEQ